MVTLSAPADGAKLSGGIKKITVTFDESMDTSGCPDGAKCVDNYLLVMQTAKRNFETQSCLAGVAGTDKEITIDSVSYVPKTATLYINGNKNLSKGKYKLFVCGTTSIHNSLGAELNNGASDSTVEFTVSPAAGGGGDEYLPATGFAPGRVTLLADQPDNLDYSDPSMSIEIPSLGIKSTIVGVPLVGEKYDISWLNDNIGWLDQTAFPGWEGNSVLTGHNYKANGLAGPFAALANAKYDDEVFLRYSGDVYIYRVRSVNTEVTPSDTTFLGHKENAWMTLITCQGYSDASKSYRYRTVVQAELLAVR